MSTSRTDVVVIGGGPAGATIASLLSMRGIATAVIDRDRFPRDKLCGEFLSYDALPVIELLGLAGALDASGAASIRRCRVAGRTRTYEFDFPRAARGISRLTLDEMLLGRAADAGALRLDGWNVTSLERDGDEWRVDISNGEQTRRIETRFVVGAWGRWGRIDLQMRRRFVRDQGHRHFGFKRHYRARASPGNDDSITLHSFDGGYLGVSSIEDSITNICGLVHRSRIAGMRDGWDGFIRELRREDRALDQLFASHEPAQEGFLSSEPVIFRPRSCVENGVLMIGDAAGLIDPLTGNGMAMAMQSALLAAVHLVRGVQRNHRRAMEQRYETAYSRLFHNRLRWSRATAFVLSRPLVLNPLLLAGHTPAIGELLLRRTRAGDSRLARLLDDWAATAQRS